MSPTISYTVSKDDYDKDVTINVSIDFNLSDLAEHKTAIYNGIFDTLQVAISESTALKITELRQ